MKLIDVIAITGALAWTPHLISIARSWLTKSKIRIITQNSADIGFTTYGPIFNLRLAFAVENKDIVVTDLKIIITHESGEKKEFGWQGITQQLGNLTMPDAGVMRQAKEHSVLAIKLNQKDIEEREIRFQELAYIKDHGQLLADAMKSESYLKSENKFVAAKFLRSKEMKALYSFNKQAFAWKQGKYTASIEMNSPNAFSILDNKLEFSLSSVDIDELEKNKDLIEEFYKCTVENTEMDPAMIWQWCNPALYKA